MMAEQQPQPAPSQVPAMAQPAAKKPKAPVAEEEIDEDYIELKCYIKYNMYYGHKIENIRKVLIDSGWDEDLVDKAFHDVKRPQPFIPKPKAKHAPVGKFIKHTPKPAPKREILPPPPIPAAPPQTSTAAQEQVMTPPPKQEPKEKK